MTPSILLPRCVRGRLNYAYRTLDLFECSKQKGGEKRMTWEYAPKDFNFKLSGVRS